MKVSELIRELQKYDDNLEVLVHDGGFKLLIESVDLIQGDVKLNSTCLRDRTESSDDEEDKPLE